jgi:citronellyl-CoA dehydrogenase
MIYGPEHLELQASLSRLIATEINPYVDQWEAAGAFPAHEVFRKLGKQSLLGINKPVEFGGLGLDYTFATAYHETLGEVRCGAIPMAIGVQSDMATPALAKHGSDALREEFLQPSISGEMVACLGVSETGAGSDGAQADWMCALVNTSEDAPHRSKSLVCIPMKTPGVSTSQKFDKLGMRASDTVQVFFDGVRVPQRYRIGEEGMGFIYQMEQFQEERLFAASSSLRALDIALEDTIAYVRQRHVFGRSITSTCTFDSPSSRPRSNCCVRSSIARWKSTSPVRTC